MPHAPDDLTTWRRAILADEADAQRQLAALDERNHVHCIHLCHELLSDDVSIVQRTALILLSQRGDPNDPVAERGALALLEQPELEDDALVALGRVATPTALPKLFAHAENGSVPALAALLKLARSDADRQRLLRVARQQLFSQQIATRAEALRVLRTLSSPAAEEDLLLRAAKRYYDAFVIAALGDASKRVLPALQELLPRFPTASAEYRNLSLAIRRLQLSIQRGR